MTSPYAGLAARAYWRSGVVERHPLDPGDIYLKKYSITESDKIATAGSCFAQHIVRRLRQNNYTVVDEEPAPPGLTGTTAMKFGYDIYSARYGNIYTTRQLIQLTKEAMGQFEPTDCVWSKDGRYFDALRPSVEPHGLDTPEMVADHRRQHLACVASIFRTATIFVFTLGLTETWVHKASGTVYPTAPGTIAGSYNPQVYEFKNLTYQEVVSDFEEFRLLMKSFNPNMRFILTVSPVPLTATASGEHVLPATIYSKSVLRSAAGYLAAAHADIDYFPSYEIIAGMQARGFFYESNLREVSASGVDVVMRCFFDQHTPISVPKSEANENDADLRNAQIGPTRPWRQSRQEEIVCEEVLLEGFGR